MKFSISTLTDLFHQFPVSDAYRTDKFREALNDKFVDYCAKDSRDGQNVIRKFLIHEVESSWIAKSNGNAVISVEVSEAFTPENRQITMTVGRIEKVNGQDVPQVVKWEG
jgi:hypothetical protein